MSALTKPTTGRLVLWIVLALVWLLLLPQDLAMDPRHRHFSWVGATFWLVVLAWLLSCAWITGRKRRASHAR
jgi:uncharacterized membrane protein